MLFLPFIYITNLTNHVKYAHTQAYIIKNNSIYNFIFIIFLTYCIITIYKET